jgi:hypothetical protein
MKILSVLVAALVIISASGAAYAQESTLGEGNFGLKIDYISFTEDEVERNDLDSGVYIGFEGYAQVAPRIYFGGEVGYASPDGSVGGVKTELTYVPVELNFKYADEAAPNTTIAVGGGLSYNYVEETSVTGGSASTTDDWILGGQIFADILYTSGQFFVGANLKYQFTENFDRRASDGSSYGYKNWRLGGTAGVMF